MTNQQPPTHFVGIGFIHAYKYRSESYIRYSSGRYMGFPPIICTPSISKKVILEILEQINNNVK